MPTDSYPDKQQSSWFALRVKANHEKNVSKLLSIQGYEEFVPTYRVRRRRAQRWQEVDTALFGGYVFCRFDRSSWARVIDTPGVIDVVRVGKALLPVDGNEIEALQIVNRSRAQMEPGPYLCVGQPVNIMSGPLADRSGTIVNFKGSTRLVLLVTLLQRSVLVEIDRDWISYRSAAPLASVVSEHARIPARAQ
jgi:transcription antitermination factor NusG